MDALGHVNNIMYFRYFEQTRLAWFESMGQMPLASGETGTVIVDNHAEYLQPVVYPANLIVSLSAHSPGRSSFVSTYTIVNEGIITTRGSAKVVWIDSRLQKSVPLPENIRSLVASCEISPDA